MDDTEALDFTIELSDSTGEKTWIAHPNDSIDIGVIPVVIADLKKYYRKYDYFRSEKRIAKIQDIKDKEIIEGESVFIIGYPLGMVGK
jgi:hypothetical protein